MTGSSFPRIFLLVIPAKAGIQFPAPCFRAKKSKELDPGFRRDDELGDL